MEDFINEITQLITPIEDEDEFEFPNYSDKGYIIVDVYELDEIGKELKIYNWEYEVVEYDASSSVFWIREGTGIDWFLDKDCEFSKPGRYRIDNIYGHYTRGTWGFDDDWEEWYHDEPVLIEEHAK